MSSIIDQYTKEELENIVKASHNMKEVIQTIGYATNSGNNNQTVKNRLNLYNIDYSHFTSSTNKQIRTEENVFIENSTASQATLRRWYIKGNYTPYICSICKQEPIWQGKDLTLILDHINGNNKDDRLENLRWVCPNCNQQLETTGFKKMRSKRVFSKEKQKFITTKQKYCVDCGKTISYHATRCKDCASKFIAQSNVLPITREELKQKIRILPFTTIAKEFSVSDNAIRKWCDKYNLPRTKRDITKYSDEEWQNI